MLDIIFDINDLIIIITIYNYHLSVAIKLYNNAIDFYQCMSHCLDTKLIIKQIVK